MPGAQEVVGAVAIAGIPCRVECRDRGFGALLARRYAGFLSGAVPEIALQVEVTAPAPGSARARRSGPFARIAGEGETLAIEGAGFRGAFDERSGQGWISQPRDPAPLETFLTAIYAGRLLRDGGFFLHAAALIRQEAAHVFFGPSGSGKTTVARLAGAGVITDEIAAIRRDGAGYRVWGVPWRGTRRSAPLAGLYRLRKARAVSFGPLSPAGAVRRLLPSVLFPRADSCDVDRFLEIAGHLVSRVPCYEMRFSPDPGFWRSLPGAG